MSFNTAALLLAWITIVILSFAVSGLAAQVSRTRQQMAGDLPPPARLSGLRLPAGPAETYAGHLLLFVSPSCELCTSVLDAMPALRSDRKTLIVWSTPPERVGAPPSNEVVDVALFRLLNVLALPYAVALNSQGIIERAQPVSSVEALKRLSSELIQASA